MRNGKVIQASQPANNFSDTLNPTKFDHEERIIICTAEKRNDDDESWSYHENRVTFTTHIYSDPIDPNWVAYLRECRERFAVRHITGIIASPKSLYSINKNLKIVNVLPSVTHWEQFTVWNGLDGKIQTLRIAKKREISNRFRTPNIINEKHVMHCCEFPFVLDFHFHFQTTDLLCMVVEQLPGESLQHLVLKLGKVPFRQAQFYASQVVLGLEYLHAMEVILRDLRLENIIICRDGYVKLADMGNSILMSASGRTWYEEYRPGVKKITARLGFHPPEVWLGEQYGPAVDWWSFGLLLYKLYSGNDCFPEEPPSQFYEEHMKRKIFDLHYDTPRWFTAADRKMFKELLMIEPKDRLGSMPEGVLAIKNHPWFRGVSWISLYGGLEKVPEIPPLSVPEADPGDTSIIYPEESEKPSSVKNPFPYGYQFQKF